MIKWFNVLDATDPACEIYSKHKEEQGAKASGSVRNN